MLQAVLLYGRIIRHFMEEDIGTATLKSVIMFGQHDKEFLHVNQHHAASCVRLR